MKDIKNPMEQYPIQKELKEVKDYKRQVEFVRAEAEGLLIDTDEKMEVASDLLNDLKKVEKAIIERKQSITRPLMEALASARDLFKPLEISYGSAKKIINDKIIAYSTAEEERIAKVTASAEKRVVKGTMRPDTAVKKIEEAGEVTKSFGGTTSKTSIRKITKVRIVDESKIPREFMVPDMKKITNAVLKEKNVIPGIEIYEEKSIVSRSR